LLISTGIAKPRGYCQETVSSE